MGVNRVMLLVAVVLGVLATLLGFVYLSTVDGAGSQSEADALALERSTAIVQVVRDLPPGHKINTANDLKTIEVPSETFAQLVQTSVKGSELRSLEGRELSLPIAAGQMLTYADLVQARDIELGPDRRAYAMDVSGPEALQGLLMPGDRIDLIVMRPKRADPVAAAGIDTANLTDEQTAQLAQAQLGTIFSQMAREIGGRDGFESEIILEDVKVLAVGNRLAGSRLEMVARQREYSQRSNMVTLDVSIEQALMLAEESAHQFRILLRPKVQQAVVETTGGGLRPATSGTE